MMKTLILGWLSVSPKGGDGGTVVLWCCGSNDGGESNCCTRGGDDGARSWFGTTRLSDDMLGRLCSARRHVLGAPRPSSTSEDEDLHGCERPLKHALARWPVPRQRKQRKQRDGERH
jgi:hypothetical protein